MTAPRLSGPGQHSPPFTVAKPLFLVDKERSRSITYLGRSASGFTSRQDPRARIGPKFSKEQRQPGARGYLPELGRSGGGPVRSHTGARLCDRPPSPVGHAPGPTCRVVGPRMGGGVVGRTDSQSVTSNGTPNVGLAPVGGGYYILIRSFQYVNTLQSPSMVKPAPQYIAYLRVSTARQGESGLGLDAQRKTVEDFARQHGGVIVAQHVEVESGKRSDRPELAKALATAKKGRATLLIAKLDRLARNVTFIAGLMDAGIDFVACDQPFASRLTLHILAAVAEDEARRTSERTKAALAAAKARGVKLGSPRAAETAVIARAARSAYATKANATTRSVIGEIQRSGISTLLGIAKTLEARGVRTPAGNMNWQPTQVARLLG